MFSARKQPVVRPNGRIESVEVDENLTALERGRHFGNSKLSLQRRLFVKELVDCAHEIGYEATVSFLLPLVRHLANDPEVLVRQSLVGQFGDLAGFLIQSDPEKGYQRVVDDLLPIVSLLLTEKASEVRNGAAEALTTLASHLRPGERGDQVLMTVISLSHSNDDEDARTVGVQLLNSLAETLGEEKCSQFVGIELVALCQDPSFRVRKATASNFAEVCRTVSPDYVLKRLMPEYSKLVSDAHWGVRKAAAENLINVAMALPACKRKAKVVPLMTSLLNDSSRWVRVAALQQLGYVIGSLEQADRVPDVLMNQYVEIIEQAKSNPDALYSYHCGFTFASVVKTMGADNWPVLRVPFASLCCDKSAQTRKVMAASMHIVAQTLGTSLLEKEVLPQFEALLQDPASEVRESALKNASNIARAAPGVEHRRRVFKAVQSTMAKADSWRFRQLIASQLGPLCEALIAPPTRTPPQQQQPSESIEEEEAAPEAAPGESAVGAGAADADAGVGAKEAEGARVAGGTGTPDDDSPDLNLCKDLAWSTLVPLFRQLCIDGVAEVRDEAARSTARVLKAAAPEMFEDPSKARESSSEGSSGGMARQPRQPEAAKLVRSFARGRSFRYRMAYIRMCDSVIREAPPHVFTGYLIWPLVKLTRDEVKNVRLCWASTMLPHIRQAGRFRQNQLLVVAAARMQKAAQDKDIEVFNVLSHAKLGDLEIDDSEDLADFAGLDSNSGEGWREGGTGDSSECSDAGVDDEAPPEASSVPAGTAPSTGGCELDDLSSLAPLAAASVPAGASPSSLSSTGGTDAPAASGEDQGANTAAVATALTEVAGSPKAASSSPKASSSSPKASGSAPAQLLRGLPTSPVMAPSSPPQVAAPAPQFDPVEDGLVEQCELERNMDKMFADRRLLAEADEMVQKGASRDRPSLSAPLGSEALSVLASIAGEGAAAAVASAVDTVAAKTANVAAAAAASAAPSGSGYLSSSTSPPPTAAAPSLGSAASAVSTAAAVGAATASAASAAAEEGFSPARSSSHSESSAAHAAPALAAQEAAPTPPELGSLEPPSSSPFAAPAPQAAPAAALPAADAPPPAASAAGEAAADADATA